jgi:hypothetical protein
LDAGDEMRNNGPLNPLAEYIALITSEPLEKRNIRRVGGHIEASS